MSRVLPILFNTDMVRAILDGRKTVTRRCVKFLNGKNPNWTGYVKDGLMLYNGTNEPCIKPCKYQPGDILYVRETWGISNLDYDGKIAYIVYKGSENEKDEGCRAVRLPEDKFEKLYDSMAENNPDWHPSIHMPKEAARIWLKVKDVRVERLQEITIDGIRNEGLTSMAVHAGDMEIALPEWKNLCNSTIKKSDLDRYGWDANPWVWVIEFERCEKPENM